MNDCEVQDWAGRFVRMVLYIQDYINLLVLLGTKHFNSASVKEFFSITEIQGKYK